MMMSSKIHLDRYNRINKKINHIIEWILNDMPLLNNDARRKLEADLVGNLRYIKNIDGRTLKVEVID